MGTKIILGTVASLLAIGASAQQITLKTANLNFSNQTLRMSALVEGFQITGCADFLLAVGLINGDIDEAFIDFQLVSESGASQCHFLCAQRMSYAPDSLLKFS